MVGLEAGCLADLLLLMAFFIKNPNTQTLIKKWMANKKFKTKADALAALKCKT